MFTTENTSGYTEAELAALNKEWLDIVWDEKLVPDTDEYHQREKEFADDVSKWRSSRKKLEINTNNEWLRMFSPVDFEGIPEGDCDSAADDFTKRLWNRLESFGFDVERAKGQRSLCHGWNGANTFTHKLGPVGSFQPLTETEEEEIFRMIDAAEADMRSDWVDDNEFFYEWT